MPRLFVPQDQAVAIRRRPGANVTIINDSAFDIVADPNINVLLSGSLTDGTVIQSGDSYEWTSFPDSGIVWVRASTIAANVKVIP